MARSKETTVLLVVAGVALLGLVALQLARHDNSAGSDEKTLVQSGKDAPVVDPQARERYQHVSGNFIHTSEQPEVDKPFFFKTDNFAQGPVYEVDPGDGSGRKPLEKGALKFVYRKPGPVVITLFARYEGEEKALDTLQKRVATKPEKIKNIVDF